MIDDYAAYAVQLPVGKDDPVRRIGDEIILAAESYAAADPTALSGSARNRISHLLCVVGLAGRVVTPQ